MLIINEMVQFDSKVEHNLVPPIMPDLNHVKSWKSGDANLNRHVLRPNKNIEICYEPQSTRFETKQKYWNTC